MTGIDMTNENQEQVEVRLGDIQKIWHLFSNRLRQKAISQKIGLPVPLVRAVLFGHYSVKGDKALVDMQVMPVREARWR